MTDEATALSRPATPLRARIAVGVRQAGNWLQLLRFAVVGAMGYGVNLGVFALGVGPLDLGHAAAATVAFLVAVTNNFWWNRHWTFRAGGGDAAFQAARFVTVSLSAFLVALAILHALVVVGLPELPSQAISLLCATPVNFLGNRLWSFRR